MLNKWIGIGRITRELELTQTGNTTYVRFSMAVERDYQDANGNRETDFIDCVAWGKLAEFIATYFGKGRMILVEGQLNKRSYTTQNNEKRYVTEINVQKAYFTGEAKKDAQNGGYAPQTAQDDGIPAGFSAVTDEDIPF